MEEEIKMAKWMKTFLLTFKEHKLQKKIPFSQQLNK